MFQQFEKITQNPMKIINLDASIDAQFTCHTEQSEINSFEEKNSHA